MMPAGNGGPLEDHLRSLILTNSDSRDAPNADPLTHMTTSSPANLHPSHESVEANKEHHSRTQAATRGGKRRPNQAQRRQMNAELSIPIDPRAVSQGHFKQYNKYYDGDKNQQQRVFHSPGPMYVKSDQNRLSTGGNHDYPLHGQSYQDHTHPSARFQPNQSNWQHLQYNTNVAPAARHSNPMLTNPLPSQGGQQPPRAQRTLYNPGSNRQTATNADQLATEIHFLNQLCHPIIAGAEIGPEEIAEKENFRLHIEGICRDAISHHELADQVSTLFEAETVQLKCFGSLASGFATKAADMDLGLVSPMSQPSLSSPDSPIPRLIEGALLDAGFGARLLTRTRVPIIKLCETPQQQLRRSLLDARKKWEMGIIEDDRDVDEEVVDEAGASQSILPAVDGTLNTTSNDRGSSEPRPSSKATSTENDLLCSFKQVSNQGLNSYYGAAKKLLRRLGVRDIRQSNSQDFSDAEFVLLDQVSYAFVCGLNDAELRKRILQHPSFNVGDKTRVANFRSLFGVYEMIEGEVLLMTWEQRPLSMKNCRGEEDAFKVVDRWNTLHRTKSFGAHPASFNKELQLAVDGLRSIPSVQLMRLRQEASESPVSYQERAQTIVNNLTGGFSRPDVDIHPGMIQYYVKGIADEEIKGAVHSFVESTKVRNLRTVARVHKALYLAAEYKRALKKGLYSAENVDSVTHYVAVLRRQPLLNGVGGFSYILPIYHNEKPLLGTMERLGDPSALGANKQKGKYHDSLEFPKTGVGVQCDINFSAHLALQNTSLLRCYSYTDWRVRPLVLFVKHWAKARDINTPYRGTLSSYGYVLMVLHYLVNIVEPFVCPNLQKLAPPDPPNVPPDILGRNNMCQGRDVRFWRDELAIQSLAQQGQLNQNSDSLGALLRGFFEYYAQAGMMSTGSKRGFDWGRDVLSLRTFGGTIPKAEKGWTGAKTVLQVQTGGSFPVTTDTTALRSPPGHNSHDHGPDAPSPQPLSPSENPQSVAHHPGKPQEVKEVRHRYLFAIEDPFELDHNVARTVTHNGIVAIRGEFRRAWRIIKNVGTTGQADDFLLEDVKLQEEQRERKGFLSLLGELHGESTFSN